MERPNPLAAAAGGPQPGWPCFDDVARSRVASAADVLAGNTRVTYASQWNRVQSWCELHGVVDPLDAGPAQRRGDGAST